MLIVRSIPVAALRLPPATFVQASSLRQFTVHDRSSESEPGQIDHAALDSSEKSNLSDCSPLAVPRGFRLQPHGALAAVASAA